MTAEHFVSISTQKYGERLTVRSQEYGIGTSKGTHIRIGIETSGRDIELCWLNEYEANQLRDALKVLLGEGVK